MTRIKKLKGFTLIELIVVVIIIGVLAAIAAVAYNQFVANARTTSAKADAKQVVTAVSAYGQQNDQDAYTVLKAQTNSTLGVTGDVFIDTTGLGATKSATSTVTVYAGKDANAKHYCVLDASGDLPFVVANSCV